MVLAALVSLIAVAGAAPPEYITSFGPDGTASSDFGRVSSVAVDRQTGHVYVLDSEAGSLYKFDADGQPVDWGGTALNITGNRIDGLSLDSERYVSQIAVDSTSHVVYVTEEHSLTAFQANGEPAVFSTGPGEATNEIPGFGKLRGLAVDAEGTIYASDQSADTISVYASTGAPITTIAQPAPAGLAVAPDGALYVIEGITVGGEFGEGFFIRKLTPDTFPVTVSTTYTTSEFVSTPAASGAFMGGVGVDPVTSEVYVLVTNFSSSWIRKYDKGGTFLRSWGEPGTPGDSEGFGQPAQGIAAIGAGKDLRLYVGNSETFEAPNYSKVDIFGTNIVEGPPAIKSTSALDVTADSATLRAVVNPNTAQTTYRFEYGLEDCSVSTCTSVPVGGAMIAAGFEPVTVTQPIAGLQAGTTYHYRVVAENSFSAEPTEGPDATFTTQTSGLGFELADSRAWEMVSPPNKHGALLVGAGPLIQAAADGNGLAYASRGSIEPHPDGSRVFEATAILARRGGDGWRSKDLALPNHTMKPAAGAEPGEYKLFTPDLSRALTEPRDGAPLSPQSSERAPHLRENTEPPVYTPLVTGKEGFANVPPGTVFGGSEQSSRSVVQVVGANADLSHVVLRSRPPLVDGAPEGALYLWRAGQLRLLNVLPADEGGAIVPQSFFGSEGVTARNALSADGSRVFWSHGNSGFASDDDLTALYLRDTLAEETVRLDVVQGGSGAGAELTTFQGASADGTVVFFKDSQQLTADASPSGRDLYRCEIPPGPAPAGCATLTDITAPIEGSGESAEVQGLVAGMSGDGTRIYFVAKGVLDSAPNQYGDSAEAGGFNLYRWQQGAGVRFIAALTAADDAVWGLGGSGAGTAFGNLQNAAHSPNGRYLSFMSETSISGYVNLEATSGEPAQEVFRYDAVQDELACVSCNPSGAAPQGQATKFRDLVDPQSLWQGRWLAAVLPQMQQSADIYTVLHRRRAVLDNGRIFFHAFDSLVPADSNGEWDVYQWEPTGLGDCTASSGGASIVRSAGGCVSLLSSGTAEEEAGFLEASPSGEDVFFLTTAKLSITDEDEERDVYDARVGGEPATLSPRGECQGEACQPPATPPLDPTPASAAFEGSGNVRSPAPRRCGRGKRKVRRAGKVRCVARKQSRRQARAQQRRAGQERRAVR